MSIKYSEIFAADEVLSAGTDDIIVLAIVDGLSPTGFTSKAIKAGNLLNWQGVMDLGSTALDIVSDAILVTDQFKVDFKSKKDEDKESRLILDYFIKTELSFRDYIAGTNLIKIDETGFLVQDELALKGAFYAADYSANFVALSLITKGYADTNLGGESLNPIFVNPTGFEDGFVPSWDDSAQEYTLVPNLNGIYSGDGTFNQDAEATLNGFELKISGVVGTSTIFDLNGNVSMDGNGTRFTVGVSAVDQFLPDGGVYIENDVDFGTPTRWGTITGISGSFLDVHTTFKFYSDIAKATILDFNHAGTLAGKLTTRVGGLVFDSGDLDILGNLKIVDGTEGNIGDVWTSTDALGNGEWSAGGGVDLNGIYTGTGTMTATTVVNMPGTKHLTFGGASGDLGSVRFGSGVAGNTLGQLSIDRVNYSAINSRILSFRRGNNDDVYLSLDVYQGGGRITANASTSTDGFEFNAIPNGESFLSSNLTIGAGKEKLAIGYGAELVLHTLNGSGNIVGTGGLSTAPAIVYRLGAELGFGDEGGRGALRLYKPGGTENAHITASLTAANYLKNRLGLGFDSTDFATIDGSAMLHTKGGDLRIQGTSANLLKADVSQNGIAIGFDGNPLNDTLELKTIDFKVEGFADPNLFKIDEGIDSVGLGVVPSANYKFRVKSTTKWAGMYVANSGTPISSPQGLYAECTSASTTSSTAIYGIVAGSTGNNIGGEFLAFQTTVGDGIGVRSTAIRTTTGTNYALYLEAENSGSPERAYAIFAESGHCVFNQQLENWDFQIGSDLSPNMFHLKGSTNNIGIRTATPDASAIIDFTSTTQGVLMPRMSSGQAAAITPVDGLVVYVTVSGGVFTQIGFWGYVNGAWSLMA